MYVQHAYFAKCKTTAKPQTTLKFSDQGYKTERLKFQVSLPSIVGPSVEPDSHCFIERFSYDLEMKTREQNRNDKRTEIERFDWFIERTDKRAWLFIG